MNTRLVILSVNILLLSIIIGLYGLYVGDNGLIGLATSTAILGGVLLVYGVETEPSYPALVSYLKLLLLSSTSVLEDLDLLNSKVCGVNDEGRVYVVYTRSTCPDRVNPGLGFNKGSPYYSIPVELEATSTEEVDESRLEEYLRTILVSELEVCRGVRVEYHGELITIDLIGLNKALRDFANYPLNPYVLLTLAVVAKLQRQGKISLTSREDLQDHIRLSIKVERGAEQT